MPELPPHCKRRVAVDEDHWGSPWEGQTVAVIREPGDLPRHITSPGGVPGWSHARRYGWSPCDVRAHPSSLATTSVRGCHDGQCCHPRFSPDQARVKYCARGSCPRTWCRSVGPRFGPRLIRRPRRRWSLVRQRSRYELSTSRKVHHNFRDDAVGAELRRSSAACRSRPACRPSGYPEPASTCPRCRSSAWAGSGQDGAGPATSGPNLRTAASASA
jgi:hypothetical protein